MHPSLMAVFLLFVSLVIFVVASLFVIRSCKFGYIGCAFCIYHIIFFLFPAILHTSENIFPFYSMSYDSWIQDKSSLIVLLFSMFFFIGFFLSEEYNYKKCISNQFELSQPRFFLACIFMFIMQVVMLLLYGFDIFMVARKDFELSNLAENMTTSVAIIGFARSISFLSLFLVFYFKNVIGKLQFYCFLLIFLLFFFVFNYPLSLPRYIFFSYLLAFFYVYFNPTLKNKMFMFFVFFVGVTTIFPYFSFITRGSSEQFELGVINYYKTNGDFDGYQSTLNVVQYTTRYFFTLGKQLIGAVLIFIPRTVWEGKPYATGQVAAEDAGYDFTNISAPLVAELYMDFGYLGVTIGAVLLGCFIRKLDAISIIAKELNDDARIIISAIVFSFSLIVFRGSLIAVIANVMLEIMIATIILKFISIKNNE